jgi:hypothetical protein
VGCSWFQRSASMQRPSVIREELMATISRMRCPALPVRAARSDPAKSTNDRLDSRCAAAAPVAVRRRPSFVASPRAQGSA